MMKNHFIVPSGINAAPFGVTHRCATTSRIEYSEDVKIDAIPATPTADRIGAFAGRVSRARSRNGRTRSAMIGMPLNRSPQNAALNTAFSGVPSPSVNWGKMSATLRRPHENRRYQSGTISSDNCGLRAGPRNGVTNADRKNMIAVSKKIVTRSRVASCGNSGMPGWWSARCGPYCLGNPGRPSRIFSLTRSISMDTSVGLRDSLQPHEAHVQDHEPDHDQGQDEDVQPVEPQDVHTGQGVDVPEQEACELVPDHGRGAAHVDPDVRGALAQVVRRQQVSGVAEGQSEQEQDDTQEPVQLPRLLVGAGEVDAAHVEEHGRDHDVGGPVVHPADDEPERDVVHDDEHGTPGGVRQVTRRADLEAAVGDVEETEQDARDREDDERDERDAAETVERIPIPDRLEFVLLRMAPRQLSLVRLEDDPREVRIGHRREAGLDPAEDRAPRILPDVPRGRRGFTSTVDVPAELLRLPVRGQRRSSDEG